MEGDNLLLTCIYIFFARIIDVTIGTIRTISLVKGKKVLASVLAFFEVMIWLIVIKRAIIIQEKNLLILIFYSAGYAVGTLLGSFISEKFIGGLVGVQVIVERKEAQQLINKIREKGYGISIFELKDNSKEKSKDMLLVELNKKNLKDLINLIKCYEKNSFIIINDTRCVYNGIIK